jgi:hypothetical protein
MEIEQRVHTLLNASLGYSTYSRGKSDFSVTQLLGPEYITYLAERHRLEPDPSVAEALGTNNYYALMGTAVHSVIENAVIAMSEAEGSRDVIKSCLVEERLFVEVCADDGADLVVSGQADLIIDGWIVDWKFASTWEVLNGIKPERARQLNLLACLARRNGMAIKGVAVCMIFRDWSKSKAKFDRSYPQQQAYVARLPLMDEQDAEAYMMERVNAHHTAREAARGTGGAPAICSKEDRWARDDVFAVRKGTNKRAVKLYNNERDAKEHADESKGLWVEHRLGESVRCSGYCDYKSICPYGAKL